MITQPCLLVIMFMYDWFVTANEEHELINLSVKSQNVDNENIIFTLIDNIFNLFSYIICL